MKLNVFSFDRPHHLSFHMSWLGFFISFVSTFAAAPMIPVIREDLGLTKPQLGNAGLAAVTGTIICRVLMGTVCDLIGPRLGLSVILLATAPFCFAMAMVQGFEGFLICRLGIGLGLATFVACQFWMSCMFNSKCVGLANATAAGWGNLGGGVTQFLMPGIYAICYSATNSRAFTAWRWAYIFPGMCHTVVGLMVMYLGQDLPDGNYKVLTTSGALEKKSSMKVNLIGMKNYRMWCMVATYGFCFGVELTMNNIVAGYLFDQFGVSLSVAGVLASCYGMMNLFARSVGGIISDWSSTRFGMRGRLWTLWSTQTLEGVLCIFMGLSKDNLGATIAFMVFFSICVQASEGASYGIVPFISRRALGVVSGFIGAGGNAGATISTALFFTKDSIETYEGLQYLGYTVIGVTALVIPIHFPMWGSMFFPASKTATEEDYYIHNEFTPEEIKAGLAAPVQKFCNNSRNERPVWKREQDAVEASA
jgi:NNP family nitrate/nitrite transporter-like MFS transporter